MIEGRRPLARGAMANPEAEDPVGIVSTDEATMPGPVQMLVIGFAEPNFTGEILAELQRLKDADVIRLVDLLVVAKDEDGDVTSVQTSDLSTDEAMEYGAMAGALIGLGTGGPDDVEAGALVGAAAGEDGHLIDQGDVWFVADTIPEGTAAAIALIEHRWAIPLRDSIVGAGGIALSDRWIHPADLVAVGLAAAGAETA
jgi:uncharacterized membrane protein